MKTKQLLLRGAAGFLLATGTVGVAVVTTAVPVHAVGESCSDLDDRYKLFIGNAESWYAKGAHFAASGYANQAAQAFGFSYSWYASANSIQRC
jgi:hypothetical protein